MPGGGHLSGDPQICHPSTQPRTRRNFHDIFCLPSSPTHLHSSAVRTWAVSRGDAEVEETQMASSRSVDDISGEIVDAAYRLHRRLGPGLLESVYESILARHLSARGFRIDRQKQISFDFEGQHFNDGLRVDLLVEEQVVLEIKSVETVAPVHIKQALTYLRLLDLRVGLVINFGGATLKEGIRRLVNDYTPPSLASRSPPRLRANLSDPILAPSSKA